MNTRTGSRNASLHSKWKEGKNSGHRKWKEDKSSGHRKWKEDRSQDRSSSPPGSLNAAAMREAAALQLKEMTAEVAMKTEAVETITVAEEADDFNI
jgi:hypothetical protein